jgi:hypothetical protein
MQQVLPACSAYAELKLQSVQLEDPAFASLRGKSEAQ